mmetsp:Transcript_19156/g.18295  ORF Transcript_19156/g.18295 Transcript_19156/m.18295 type:complete len:103 (-) Transcript_19156:1649-1957(-)
MDKVHKNEIKNKQDLDDYNREQKDLSEYEESYKTRMDGFQKEMKDMEDYEKYLHKSVFFIDSTLDMKQECKQKTFQIKLDINNMKNKRDNALRNKEYLGEQI